MAAGKFTLADRLGAKSVPCRVAGCSRTWIQLSNKAFGLGGSMAPAAGDATEGMCDPCREKFRTLQDSLRPCDRKGCTGTWTWPVMAQLEAFATKRPAPKHLCEDCQKLLDSLQDKEIPCAVPGCTRTATLTREQQLVSQGEPSAEAAPSLEGVTIPGLLCEPCAQVARKLKDRAVNCGIIGCSRKWTWKANDQIQAFAAGKPNEPPRRMCAECRAEFGKLGDREIRCRTSGCKTTWTWTRSDQLDTCVADKPAPKAPSRMCQRCFDLWSSLKDVERPCRRAGCKGTWSDKRGAQLARLVRGKSAEPYPRYCGDCEKELGISRIGRSPVGPTAAREPSPGARNSNSRPGCGPSSRSHRRSRAHPLRPRFSLPAATAFLRLSRLWQLRPTPQPARARPRPRQRLPRRLPPRHLPRPRRARARRTAADANRSHLNGVARPAPSFWPAERRRKSPASSVARPSTGRRRASYKPTWATGPHPHSAGRASWPRSQPRAKPRARLCATRMWPRRPKAKRPRQQHREATAAGRS